MSEQFDFPVGFKNRIRDQFGTKADDFLDSLNEEPAISVRLNPRKAISLFENTREISWTKWGRFLEQRPVFALDPLFHAGAYYVQESSSMFLEEAFNQLSLPENPTVLDLCAAPGGKSTHLLSLMNGKGLLISNEVIKTRNSILRENITRWGFANVLVSRNEAHEFASTDFQFDLIVVDAPCSGEGMFRKDPHSRTEWSEDNVNLCSLRQQKIIAEIWPSVAPGGYLIYSTCTFNPAENEAQINRLISEGGAVNIELKNINPKIQETRPGYAFYPMNTPGEGFYISVLQKPDGERKKLKLPKKNIPEIIKYPDIFKLISGTFSIIKTGEELCAIPEAFAEPIHYLKQKLNITRTGLPIGTDIRGKLQYSHDLAMSVDLISSYFKTQEVELETALEFLRKNTVDIPVGKDKWLLLTYKNIPLGWLKNAGNRWNNYFPTAWRLRMQD
ncbi:MAG: RNA methyltransferase [Bacteroidetes bacterium]|nr:RNA methyltransferase [Bacteroidota bacterium]